MNTVETVTKIKGIGHVVDKKPITLLFKIPLTKSYVHCRVGLNITWNFVLILYLSTHTNVYPLVSPLTKLSLLINFTRVCVFVEHRIRALLIYFILLLQPRSTDIFSLSCFIFHTPDIEHQVLRTDCIKWTQDVSCKVSAMTRVPGIYIRWRS